jgi:UDP-N-acetylmuramoyl-tripeptide--D-alanyl-D-alanine ligase
MLKTNTKTIAKLFNTDCENVDFAGISIDSRDCKDKLFIAIIGENLNGHDFIKNAVENGCTAVVASKKHNQKHNQKFNQKHELNIPTTPTIYTNDTTIALGKIAKFHKEQIKSKNNLKIIAITGSNGKTTTKNMLFNIFNQVAPTLKTAGNFNNHIGVPLTLLNLEEQHKFAIVEMGANHLGEIAYLQDMVNPDIACVINTLDAHIGEFGGRENLIKAKGEIYHKDSINIVNTNTNFDGNMSFGTGGDIDYEYLKNIKLQLLGAHNQENALASVAIAKSLGVTDEIIKKGLENTQAESGRLELIEKNGYQIINDCYNASPSSVKFALATLEEFDGIKIAVLGNMAELGDKSPEIHSEIGKYAKSLNIDYLYSTGDLAKNYGFMHFENFDDLIKQLNRHKSPTILLKASRSSHFEIFLDKFC